MCRCADVERLPGLLADEPVYWIDAVTDLGEGRVRTELGFSDVAAHAYESLVEGTVTLLASLAGVEEVHQEHREVVTVVSRGVAVEVVAGVVDRYWFERLPLAPVAPGVDLEPEDGLVSPWPSAPPPPQGALPEGADEIASPSLGAALREAATSLPPSRRRMWTHLVCGAIPFVGGALLTLDPGGSNGALPMAVGVFNLAIGTRIALRRRLGASRG